MARSPSNDGDRADLLRRLREFQGRVARFAAPQRTNEATRQRAELSGTHADIVARLRIHAPELAASLEQALADLADTNRKTYVGPAGEAREVMRAAIQLFGPDEDVRAQPWFQGTKQGNQMNPTQAERLRYAVQTNDGNRNQAAEAVDMIDERIGRLGRQVYQRASSAFHATNQRQEVRKLTGWVFVVLDEVLPE